MPLGKFLTRAQDNAMDPGGLRSASKREDCLLDVERHIELGTLGEMRDAVYRQCIEDALV